MLQNELPTFEVLPIAAFSNIFSDTTNSYKLYWAYAILDILKQEDVDGEIDSKDIAMRMVALAWYPVVVFKLSLGKQDQMGKTVEFIAERINAKEDDKPIEIYRKIKTLCDYDKAAGRLITDLVRYVPFRFLSPFFVEELYRINDVQKNRLISQLSSDSFFTSNPSIYKISVSKKIVFHPTWLEYLKKHLSIVESYNLWFLVRYLESRNPNVQGVSTKILPPQKRELKEAKEFWRIVLSHRQTQCIYSSVQLFPETTISIDHFVPWSFVAHDYLWNLSPTTVNVNSSKNNNLPKLDLYLPRFTAIQYEAFQIIFKTNKTKLLEDYVFLFQDSLTNISQIPANHFKEKLGKQIIPLIEIATNIGFNPHWTYQM